MTVYDKPVFSLELPNDTTPDLVAAYDAWDNARNTPLEGTPELFTNRITPHQEAVAKGAREIYDAAPTLDIAERDLLAAIVEHHNNRGLLPETGVSSVKELRSIIGPTAPYTGLPQPGEAILATIENFKIGKLYAEAIGQHAEGILMSGSNAWGSFYAVRSSVGNQKGSDVDLLVEAKDVHAIEAAVTRLAHIGLVSHYAHEGGFNEQQRAEAFIHGYLEDTVDMFSLRTHATGTEVSIHFITSDVMEKVTAHSQEMRSRTVAGQNVTYLRDMRPNEPANATHDKNSANSTLPLKEVRGYDIYDLRRLTDLRFVPEITAVYAKQKPAGYVSESPLGATIRTTQGQSYGMGLMPFFLSMSPVILSEKNCAMHRRVQQMQQAIAETMQGAAPQSLIREARIPSFVCTSIKNALTLEREKRTA